VVEGAIYADEVPRVTSLDGYTMDMVPAGNMVLLTNTDEPGRIGLVGRILGAAGVNIAEMVIGRKRDEADRTIAMMILKLDEAPTAELLEQLRTGPGILSAAAVELPPA
jgi:D-3-phosphoglycerate dehydrogenase